MCSKKARETTEKPAKPRKSQLLTFLELNDGPESPIVEQQPLLSVSTHRQAVNHAKSTPR